MQGYIDKGIKPPLPPAGCAEYLIGYLFDAGPVGHGAAGVVPLQWQELTHWQRNAGIELRPWEAITLRRLSVDYITASLDAESPTCPAPWLNDDYADADVRKATAKQIRSVLRG